MAPTDDPVLSRPNGRSSVRAVTVVILLLVASSGCLSAVGVSDIFAPGGTPAEADAIDPSSGIEVTATEVVDGDTIDIRYANGTRDRVRLLGVDSPEVHAENDPAEFQGVPNTTAGEQCLRRAGANASAFARDRLADETVTLAFDPQSERRGYYDRLLAYVYVGNQSFNLALLRQGHARVYDTAFTERERYERAAATARDDRQGLWSCVDVEGTATQTESPLTGTDGGGPLAVADIHYDAAGNDNENLNDEYVVFRNTDDEPLNLSEWTVRDEADHTYTFPDGTTVKPDAEVTLRTGSGSDTETTLYWGASGAIWNNDGDTVIVRNESGSIVVRASY